MRWFEIALVVLTLFSGLVWLVDKLWWRKARAARAGLLEDKEPLIVDYSRAFFPVLAIVLAVTGPGMPNGGWQTELSSWLQHVSASMLHALSWLPGWAVLAILAGLFAVLIGRAFRAGSSPPPDSHRVESGGTASIREDQQ